MLEKLGFQQLVEETLTIRRQTRVMPGYPWPPSRHCSVSEPGVNPRPITRSGVPPIFRSRTSRYWGLLKQPYKQESAKSVWLIRAGAGGDFRCGRTIDARLFGLPGNKTRFQNDQNKKADHESELPRSKG